MSLAKGFFRTFPHIKKSAKLGSHSGSGLLTESSSSTPAAQREEEVDVLLDIPLELRTPAQRARLFELISASSQARRRKRKKRRKRRLPRTSSRLSRCRKLWRFRSCSSSTLSSTSPSVPRRQILMVQTLQQTTEYPQLLYVSSGRCPCCWSCLSCRLNGIDMYMAGFPGHAAPRAVLLFFRQAQDPRHHGLVQNCRKLRILRSCSSLLVIDIFRSAEAVPHGLDFSADHRDSPVAVQWSMSPLCGVQILRCCRGEDLVAPTVAARTLSTTSYLAVTCLVFAFKSTGFWTFLGVTSENVPVFSAIGSTLDTCLRQVTVAFGFFSHIFYGKVDLGSRFCAMLGSSVDTCFASVFATFWPMSLLCSSCRFFWVPSWRRQSSSDGCIRREVFCEGQLINAVMS